MQSRSYHIGSQHDPSGDRMYLAPRFDTDHKTEHRLQPHLLFQPGHRSKWRFEATTPKDILGGEMTTVTVNCIAIQKRPRACYSSLEHLISGIRALTSLETSLREREYQVSQPHEKTCQSFPVHLLLQPLVASAVRHLPRGREVFRKAGSTVPTRPG